MRFKVSMKIIGGFLAVLALTLLVGIIGIDMGRGLAEKLNRMNSTRLPSVTLVEKVNKSLVELRLAEWNLINSLRNPGKPVKETSKPAMQGKSSLMEAMMDMKKTRQRLAVDVEKLKALNLESRERQYLEEFEALYKEYMVLHEGFMMAVEKENMAEADRVQRVDEEKAFKTLIVPLGQLSDYSSKLAADVSLEANRELERRQALLVGILLAALILGVATSLYLTRKISSAVKEVSAAAAQMADGDLTMQPLAIKSGDELGRMGQAFNIMIEKVTSLMTRIQNSARDVRGSGEILFTVSQQVAASSQQMATATEHMANSSTEQNIQVQEIRSMLEGLADITAKIAVGAQKQAHLINENSNSIGRMLKEMDEMAEAVRVVAEAAQKTREVTVKGSRVVTETINGIGDIQQRVFALAGRIKELGGHSQEIGEIIQVIDDIAEQTNLLALNAAIEAARAGEHGKGFAVVADEVRKLAERSGGATKEIADLISTIQAGIGNAIKAMEEGTKEVEKGSQLADQAGVALQEIDQTIELANRQVLTITEVSDKISGEFRDVAKAMENVAGIAVESATATEEMTSGSERAREAVTKLAFIAESNAATAEELSASGEEVTASVQEVTASAQTLLNLAVSLEEGAGVFRCTCDDNEIKGN